MRSYDIIIVGCGPVGAVLALLLHKYGHTVGIFERENDVYHHPRAMLMNDDCIRIMQSLGIWEELKPYFTSFRVGQTIDSKGRLIGRIVFPKDQPYGHIRSNLFYQPNFEKVLRANFSKGEGIDFYIGHEVEKVTNDEISPSIVTKNLEDGTRHEFSGKYIVGCDGARSLTKKTINPGKIDQNYSQDWFVIDAFIKDEKDVSLLPTDFEAFTGDQPVTYVPGVGLHRRLDFRIREEDFNLSNEEIKSKVPKYLKYYVEDIKKLEIIRADRYTYRAITADSWRKGRVLIAGDAAHMMPPFSGQGMQTGVRDVINLAFKLDFVLKGKAGEKLLNTYDIERIPTAVLVTKSSMFTGRMNEAEDLVSTIIRQVLFRLANISTYVATKMYEKMMPQIPYKKGFMGTNHKLAGQMMLQPLVKNLAGDELLMDEVIGNQMTIITQHSFPNALQNSFEEKTLGKIFTITKDFTDNTHILRNWMKKNKIDFVIMRPDHYIFDAGRRGQEETVLQQLFGFFED